MPQIILDKSLVETNMFRFKFAPDFKKYKHSEFSNLMSEKHKVKLTFGHKDEAIRLVTHRDVSRA